MAAVDYRTAAPADVHVTGRRVVATVIDGLVLGGAYALVAGLFGDVRSVGPWNWVADTSAGISLLYALGAAAYYVVMETALGQTLGKMVVGIRVSGAGTGGRPSGTQAVIRTALRLVDGLLGYLVAFVAVLSSERRQWLGDLAADTHVVRT